MLVIHHVLWHFYKMLKPTSLVKSKTLSTVYFNNVIIVKWSLNVIISLKVLVIKSQIISYCQFLSEFLRAEILLQSFVFERAKWTCQLFYAFWPYYYWPLKQMNITKKTWYLRFRNPEEGHGTWYTHSHPPLMRWFLGCCLTAADIQEKPEIY